MADVDPLTAIADLIGSVRQQRAELALNLAAIQHRRRTSRQVRYVLDRARAAVYRSSIVRLRLNTSRRVQ